MVEEAISSYIAAAFNLAFLDEDQPFSLIVSTPVSTNQNSSIMHEGLQSRYLSMSLDLLILAIFVALVLVLNSKKVLLVSTDLIQSPLRKVIKTRLTYFTEV